MRVTLACHAEPPEASVAQVVWVAVLHLEGGPGQRPQTAARFPSK